MPGKGEESSFLCLPCPSSAGRGFSSFWMGACNPNKAPSASLGLCHHRAATTEGWGGHSSVFNEDIKPQRSAVAGAPGSLWGAIVPSRAGSGEGHLIN